MNLCRLVPLLIICSDAIGGTVAALVGHTISSGIGLGLLVGLLPLLILATMYVGASHWRPDRPHCKNGHCRSQDYEFMDVQEIITKTGTVRVYTYQCLCGDRYLYRDGDFVSLAPAGEESPFMTISNWGRWTKTAG